MLRGAENRNKMAGKAARNNCLFLAQTTSIDAQTQSSHNQRRKEDQDEFGRINGA